MNAPTWTKHDLPLPDGHDEDGSPFWRLSTGERVYVLDGQIYTGGRDAPAACLEWDCLVHLAAVAWSRRASTDPGSEFGSVTNEIDRSKGNI